MRKVTIETCEAFIGGETKTVGNTVSTGTELILHGNIIARKTEGSIIATLAGWPTKLTRERLNGLCWLLGVAEFHQHKGEQFKGDVLIGTNDWIALTESPVASEVVG